MVEMSLKSRLAHAFSVSLSCYFALAHEDLDVPSSFSDKTGAFSDKLTSQYFGLEDGLLGKELQLLTIRSSSTWSVPLLALLCLPELLLS